MKCEWCLDREADYVVRFTCDVLGWYLCKRCLAMLLISGFTAYSVRDVNDM